MQNFYIINLYFHWGPPIKILNYELFQVNTWVDIYRIFILDPSPHIGALKSKSAGDKVHKKLHFRPQIQICGRGNVIFLYFFAR